MKEVKSWNFGGGADLSKSPFLESLSNIGVSGQAARLGFTLAEVLITLGIIGVVAAMTMPALITKINNKGYTERLIKAYSTLQNATNKIIEEEGLPSNWGWVVRGTDIDDTANDRIIELYKNNLKVVYFCQDSWIDDECKSMRSITYRSLNKQTATDIHSGNDIFGGYQFVLPDGVVLGFKFTVSTSGVNWGAPSALSFTVDVNGKKKPNIVGRDIFYFYLDNSTGKVLPFISDESTNQYANTCETNKSGHSCAYRVITEGKMNY